MNRIGEWLADGKQGCGGLRGLFQRDDPELTFEWKEGASNVQVENKCSKQKQGQMQKQIQRLHWNFITKQY